MNSVLSHPCSSVPSQVTQTPHGWNEAAVHCKAPSAVQHCTELEKQGFLQVCHLSIIKWEEARLFFAPEGVIYYFCLNFCLGFFLGEGLFGVVF